MKYVNKSVLFWVVLFFLIALLVSSASEDTKRDIRLGVSLDEFVRALRAGEISKVRMQDGFIFGEYRVGAKDGLRLFETEMDSGWDSLVGEIIESKVEFRYVAPRKNKVVLFLVNVMPFAAIFLWWFFALRHSQVGSSVIHLGWGGKIPWLERKKSTQITFGDVGGAEEAKAELREVVDFLKNPQKYRRLGARIPMGILLTGPTGTGKTLLARAVAGEAEVPFLPIAASSFVQFYVGLGAARVRELFAQARKKSPCIIFIDELDAVGKKRWAGFGQLNQEHDQTLNQILVEMDGFEQRDGIVVLASTNLEEMIDSALLRPGRFDRKIQVDRPDLGGRKSILEIHGKRVLMDRSVDYEMIARSTPGMSGAELANLINEAALEAGRQGKESVTLEDIEFARDKILIGLERTSLLLTDEELMICAYHESGHAVVAAFLGAVDPLYKITVVPRGKSLGLTMQMPLEDRHNYQKSFVESSIATLMGGRAAEELVIGDITTGAGNDLIRATDLAKQMVCDWGMSTLGPISIACADSSLTTSRGNSVQGGEFGQSSYLKERVDLEIISIVEDGAKKASRSFSRMTRSVSE